MNLNANEELHRQHYGFYTFGLFTSRRRALACIQTRGMTTGALSILPVNINEPLRPCLGSDVLTAHETRQMVRISLAHTILGKGKLTPCLMRPTTAAPALRNQGVHCGCGAQQGLSLIIQPLPCR